MGDMGKAELTPMVAVDPFHLPQSEPLALTVNNKKKEFRQEQEEKEDEVNFKRPEEKKSGFTFTVADDNGENQSFTLQVPASSTDSCSISYHVYLPSSSGAPVGCVGGGSNQRPTG